MPVSRTSKPELVSILMAEFRRVGYHELSLQQISIATGLGKASLYHHFPGGKAEMALEVLHEMQRWIDAEIIRPLNSGEGSPVARLRRTLDTLSNFYEEGSASCLLEIMSARDVPPAVRALTASCMSAILAALADLATIAGSSESVARDFAEDTLVALQGSLIVSRVTASTGPFARQIARVADSVEW
jgi:TetR/AcrR family transcriptional regulator, lmrAB and yxaGH operons repressor